MKVGVKIMPRPVLLDTQGRAVTASLKSMGQEVSSCRVGKYIELEIDASTKDEALSQAQTMAKLVLHNPLIEQFEIQILE